MKQVLRVGLVSFGYMGKMHAMGYDNLKYYYQTQAEVVLYAVVTSKKPEEIPIPFEKYYATIDELLADPLVDIVDLCGPTYLHKEQLLKAIAADKHIYCEKPLTNDLATAQEVMDKVRETGYDKINRVTFEYRFVPAILRAKQIIDEGGIGKIIHFNFKYYGCEFLDPNKPIGWQATKDLAGGGVLYALGTHSIDTIRYLVGEIKDVFAQQRTHFKQRPRKEDPTQTKKVDIEDIVNVQLTCGEDVMGTLLLSQVAAGSGIDFTFEIYGEKGALKFDHNNANVIYYYDNTEPKDPVGGYGGFKAIETTQKYGGEAVFPPARVTIGWSRYHIASIYDFVHAVLTGTGSHPDLEDAYQVHRVTDAIYRSTQSGRIETV